MTQSKSRTGIQATIEMLNGLAPDHRERLLASVAEKDPALAEEIRRGLFTFENIADLEDALLQKLVRAIPPLKLALALRGASDAVTSAVFRNLSSRAQDTLREQIDAMGPQRRTDIEAAQSEVTAMAKKLRAE